MPTPRKSEELHKLTGTKSQAQEREEYAPAAGRPRFPQGISVAARRAFRRLCLMLEQRRVLTPGDQEVLRLYCILFDRHARALAKIAEQGEICTYIRLDCHGEQCPSEKPNLWLKVAQDCESKMSALLRDLGLTPNARAKVRPAAEEPKEEKSYSELLSEEIARRKSAAPPPPPEPDYDMLANLDEDKVLEQ